MTWEPVGIIASLFHWLGDLLEKEGRPTLEADRRLFQKFMSELPSNGLITFLKNHNMGDSFQIGTLGPLYKLSESWDRSEYSFHNPKVDQARKQLLMATNAFLRAIAEKTSPKNNDFQGIYKYYNEGRNWSAKEEPRLREQMEETITTLNNLATKVFENHQSFIAIAKRKLKV